MNFAIPAPIVDKAQAEPAQSVDSPQVDKAMVTESPKALPAPIVERANIVQSKYQQERQNDDDHGNEEEKKQKKLQLQQLQVQVQQQQNQTNFSVPAFRSLSPKDEFDFCSYGAVIREKPTKNILRKFLPMIFDERDFLSYGEVKYYITVIDNLCLIYLDETSLQPYYLINLMEYDIYMENRNHPFPTSYTINPEVNTNQSQKTMITFLLKIKNHNINNNKQNIATRTTTVQQYQFTLDTSRDETLGQRFFNVVQKASQLSSSSSSSKKE